MRKMLSTLIQFAVARCPHCGALANGCKGSCDSCGKVFR
ncbi:putative C2H2 Zn-finger protein [Fictibacillus barbaricus]|uniref:C2H2 Zn-finger protein n=1 Tax=Fictibacillus barbaricus TaxID=182136 RepID=A0ABU1U5V1_9BACL|nr:putative C2H2 Zn-finger protein [Fictibacillus barbaricus]